MLHLDSTGARPRRPAGLRALALLHVLAAAALLAVAGVPFTRAGVPAAAAQSNAELILSGAHTPSHDYDLIHQRIEVSGFDWDSTAFDGRVTVTAVALRPGLDRLVLDAGRRLEVRTITAGRSRLEFDRPGDSLVVRLARPAAFGDTVRFTIAYRGRITHGRGLYFFEAETGRRGRTRQVYSGGGTDGNPYWFPTYGAPHDKATWDVIATVPAELRVVSNGRLVSDRLGPGGTRRVHWAQEQPASTYLLSLVIAPLAKVTDRWRGIPIEYYVTPADSARARAVFGNTPDILEVFTRLTGVPYPWPKYAQTTVVEFNGGMENVNATTLGDWLPDRRAELDRPWYRWALVPHEAAHQWFGNYVTTENWANMWLNEGFAQFMAGQYWAERLGPKAEADFYLADYEAFLDADARRRMPLASLGSNVIYNKGPLVLLMLKRMLGEERFWASIHRYLTRHAFGNATSDDLRQAILDATGENLAWFFNQWVYQAGYPQLEVTARYDSAAGSLSLEVKQTHPDSVPADSAQPRFTVPAAFRARIAVRVGARGGETVREVVLDRREQTFVIDGLAGPPTMVIFDDGNRLLKTLKFEQPTEWLATQLAHDPDLWNRAWVIQQLAERTDDSLAGAALAAAARTADYFLTRQQAAEALARFPAETAVPALRAAARDSSAQVRRAAVATLGLRGDTTALDVVRRAFAHDSSYEVRAAALLALAALDSAGARSAIAEGLRTPSYRDVIQRAALAATVQTGDRAMIPILTERIGDQPLVALALAAFAAQGDRAARDALTRSVDDARPWVRRWALTAMRTMQSGAGAGRPGQSPRRGKRRLRKLRTACR